jgi:hypothetical protein
MGQQRFLGLRGTKLNIAVSVIAGLDFLYVSLPHKLWHPNRVMWC